jgi:hypothetical protein
MGIKGRERRVEVFFHDLFMDEEVLRGKGLEPEGSPPSTASPSASANEQRSFPRNIGLCYRKDCVDFNEPFY